MWIRIVLAGEHINVLSNIEEDIVVEFLRRISCCPRIHDTLVGIDDDESTLTDSFVLFELL